MTYHFPKKILGSRISLTYKRLMKSYNELKKNLTKILRSFENRAPGLVTPCGTFIIVTPISTIGSKMLADEADMRRVREKLMIRCKAMKFTKVFRE